MADSKSRITWDDCIRAAGVRHEAAAYVAYHVAQGSGFYEACERENLYGNLPQVAAERRYARNVCKALGLMEPNA